MRWNPTVTTTRETADAPVSWERDGAVALVRLNRPDKRNALNLAAFTALNRIISRIHDDPAIRAVIITGEGGAFSAGADIADLVGLAGSSAYEFSATGQFVYEQIENLPQPVIAAIDGPALGGGLELALACDIRLASDRAVFALPEITLANTPGWGGTQRLPRTIGAGRAMAMMLTGAHLDAVTAERYGLITEVCTSTDLSARSHALASQLAERSPHAVAAVKRAVATGYNGGTAAGMLAERLGVQSCCGTPEQVSAVTAFLKHRTRKDR